MRRDGDLLVLAAWGVPDDTVFIRRRGPAEKPNEGSAASEASPPPLRRPLWEPSVTGLSPDTLSGLYLMADTGSWAPYSTFGVGGEGVLQVSAPPGRYLVSLEQWNPQERWGARIRHGIDAHYIPPDVPHLSDLALLSTSETLPTSLDGALPRLLSSAEFASGQRMTVAWEVYGLNRRGEPLFFELSLVGEGGSVVRRALNRIGLFRKDPFLTLSWEEEGARELGPFFRAMDVDLPPVDPGRYQLRLEMRIPNRTSVATTRTIRVF
jgi:hypothetical protein